ncbi:hypothetical protein JOD54_003215 [Actinokineospora baliensis]|nr:hypothetical protein [Actinokineospora baliensis]
MPAQPGLRARWARLDHTRSPTSAATAATSDTTTASAQARPRGQALRRAVRRAVRRPPHRISHAASQPPPPPRPRRQSSATPSHRSDQCPRERLQAAIPRRVRSPRLNHTRSPHARGEQPGDRRHTGSTGWPSTQPSPAPADSTSRHPHRNPGSAVALPPPDRTDQRLRATPPAGLRRRVRRPRPNRTRRHHVRGERASDCRTGSVVRTTHPSDQRFRRKPCRSRSDTAPPQRSAPPGGPPTVRPQAAPRPPVISACAASNPATAAQTSRASTPGRSPAIATHPAAKSRLHATASGRASHHASAAQASTTPVVITACAASRKASHRRKPVPSPKRHRPTAAVSAYVRTPPGGHPTVRPQAAPRPHP